MFFFSFFYVFSLFPFGFPGCFPPLFPFPFVGLGFGVGVVENFGELLSGVVFGFGLLGFGGFGWERSPGGSRSGGGAFTFYAV